MKLGRTFRLTIIELRREHSHAGFKGFDLLGLSWAGFSSASRGSLRLRGRERHRRRARRGGDRGEDFIVQPKAVEAKGILFFKSIYLLNCLKQSSTSLCFLALRGVPDITFHFLALK